MSDSPASSKPSKTSARDIALLRIDAIALPGWKPDTFRRPRSADEAIDARDLALADRIALAVIKHHGRLKHLIAHYTGRKLSSIDAPVQKILAVALVQLHLLTRIPARAAVDEAVEQTRRFKLGRASGLVNAVLRRATREPEPPLPEPSDLKRYIEVTLSHPWALFEKLRTVMGTDDAAIALARRHNDEPPTIVRLGRGVKMASLQAEHITLRPHSVDGMVVVEGARRADFAKWADAGLAQVQDPTSAAVIGKLDVRRKQTILDRCCGVGTKTLQMVDATGDEAIIHAIDPAKQRIALLKSQIVKRGLRSVVVHEADALEKLPDLPQEFDRILIDAPCSNSGVLMRRPEARYHQSPARTESLRKLQGQLLMECLPRLAPKGKLIYSTCSIWREENELLVGEALGALAGYRRTFQLTTLPTTNTDPTRHHDGGYTCVIERS